MAKNLKELGNVASMLKKASEKSLSANAPIIQEISLDLILENNNNYFSMEEDNEFKLLVESIKVLGVLQPIVVVKNEESENYTVIAGHRRTRASKIAQRQTIPAIIKNFNSDVESTLALIDTNLTARKLTVDEITKTIDVLENIIKQENIKVEGRIRDYIGQYLNLSGQQVQRYKAVNNLIPEIKEMIDNEQVGISSVAPIATLPEEQQKDVAEVLQTELKNKDKISRDAVKTIKEKVVNKETNQYDDKKVLKQLNKIRDMIETSKFEDPMEMVQEFTNLKFYLSDKITELLNN